MFFIEKIKLGVVFGGMSTESEVSIKSANSIITNMNLEKYDIFKIFINKNGRWFLHSKNEKNTQKREIKNIIDFLKKMDVIFPVLHGRYGEDGTIQGLFELLKIPYVGCGVLASSICMDKVYSKIVFDKAGLKQAKYEYIRKSRESDKYIYFDKNFNEEILTLNKIIQKVILKLKFPIFVKPSNSGSSIGINKAHNKEELKKFIEIASNYDEKILIEENVDGREVECAILGNEVLQVSTVGEIKPDDEYYSYDAKYNNVKSITEIPANINGELVNKIKIQAQKTFKAIDGRGLARVDFFIENDTNEIYINEINTMPGFTNISMYPKLFEKEGIKYSKLIDILINLALEKKF